MKTVYIYVLDTLADWEIGYVTSELNSRNYFKESAPSLTIKMVSHSNQPIYTMGGIKIIPNCLVEEIVLNENSTLLLPGGDTWDDPKHSAILAVAKELLLVDGIVGAICGATVAIANIGLLNEYTHTSNGEGFLELFCPTYQGQKLYLDELSVVDNNLITAGSAGSLMWTRHIIERLNVFEQDTLEAWYNYFNTGNAKYYFDLIQTLPSSRTN